MTPAAILVAVLQYGPAILPVISDIAGWIKSGKTDVTPEDIQTLISYGSKKADDYLAAAGVQKPAGTS